MGKGKESRFSLCRIRAVGVPWSCGAVFCSRPPLFVHLPSLLDALALLVESKGGGYPSWIEVRCRSLEPIRSPHLTPSPSYQTRPFPCLPNLQTKDSTPTPPISKSQPSWTLETRARHVSCFLEPFFFHVSHLIIHVCCRVLSYSSS